MSKTPSKNGSLSKVRVIVRVRPFLLHEIDESKSNPTPVVSAQFDLSDEVSVHLKDQQTSRHECYKLDDFFGREDNNVAEIFEKEVCPLIPGVFRGCNATVFAYGATGSGKTYTMQGSNEQPGLMPLAMSMVLSLCQSNGCLAEISCYEIYLDKCYDLLGLKETELLMLDDSEGQTHLKGLSQVRVNTISEFHEIVAHGIQRRRVACTSLNDVSSRSHEVLVISISTPSDYGSEPTLIGKLNLIDLAGNEDNKRSGNEGIRMLESAKINQSLLALSNVIYALNNNRSWVPYRESKLTRILQNSLGGTNHALMVACLNPGDYKESVHTVRLAARSRQTSNDVPSAQKQGTPKIRIMDMETKLRTWLESKGKTNTSQRMGPFGSPGFVSSIKKQALHHGSANAKATKNGTATVKDMSKPQRKLFEGEASSVSDIDTHRVQEFVSTKDCHSGTNEALLVLEDKCITTISSSVDFYDTERCLLQVQKIDAKGTINESVADETGNQSTAGLPDEFLEEDEKMDKFSVISRCNLTSCQSPLRTPLSPINSNVNQLAIEEVTVLLESLNPTTPFVATREKFKDFGTPLEKFTARASNMKSFLAEEYIDFLNTATREQLLELKGIGAKRAEYVIELRETSPLKSLSDLEKIGLSSKQAHQMFSKAAKSIFERN